MNHYERIAQLIHEGILGRIGNVTGKAVRKVRAGIDDFKSGYAQGRGKKKPEQPDTKLGGQPRTHSGETSIGDADTKKPNKKFFEGIEYLLPHKNGKPLYESHEEYVRAELKKKRNRSRLEERINKK
jgi:hypothetical protein